MKKFPNHMEKIADGVTEGYKTIENGVVTGYKKIEDGVVDGFGKIVEKCAGTMLNKDGSMKTGKIGEAVVSGYKKIEYAFVNTFIAKEGETVEDAKAQISGEQNSKDSE